MFCLKLIINPKIKENPKIFDFQSLNASIPNQIFRENEQSFINPIIENRPNNNANVNDELNSQNRIISNPSEFINKNENSDLIKRNSLTTQKFEMIGAINFNPPLIPTEFNNSKKKLIPCNTFIFIIKFYLNIIVGGSKKTVSFESQKSKGINEEENGTLLENLELTKLKSFKERVEVNAFYSKEVHEFVNMNDTIPDILEFLEKSLDKYLLKM